jgi:hypothetical protein
MGYYIQTPSVKGKAEYIATQYKGRIASYTKALDAMNDSTKGVIVVVDNGFFEAAGFAFNQSEFEAFTQLSDDRPREFVILDRDVAEKLSGYE